MKVNRSFLWTSVEVHELYLAYGGSGLSRAQLQAKLLSYFDDLLLLSSSGLANILLFCQKASCLVRLDKDEEDDISVEKVAKAISIETKNFPQTNRHTKLDLIGIRSRSKSVRLYLCWQIFPTSSSQGHYRHC